MIISVDPGKYATKAKSPTKQIYFPTRISTSTIPPEGNTYKVLFQDQSFIIGEMAETQDFDISKASIVHKLSTYIAITQLQGFQNHINLVLGTPLNIYKNKDLKEEYKSFMLGEKFIRLYVNDIIYSFYIDSILALPESAGVVYIYPSLFKARRAAVIDLGGLNMNFCVYENYIGQVSSMFSLNLGGNELQTNILNALNSAYGIALTARDIPYIIQRGGLKLKGEIEKESILLVNSLLDSYLQRILLETRRNGFNLDLMNTVFIGGTSKLIENKILEKVPHAFIPPDAEWANCEGFYKIGQMKYETE